MIRNTFNMVASGYDNPSFRFFAESAEHMISCLSPADNQNILDVATGTGVVALKLARQLTRGKVTAIDFSSGMLAQAKMKAEALQLRNIDFVEMDMQAIKFPDEHFDAATCAFGIFFVKDMEAQVKHIAGKVKPGGKVIISLFHEGSFEPMSELCSDCIERHGVERPSAPWRKIGTEEKSILLLQNTGLVDVRVVKKDIGYYLKNVDEWWNVIWNGGYRRYLNQLSNDELVKFKKEHLEEIAGLSAENGIWMDVKVLYAIGTRI